MPLRAEEPLQDEADIYQYLFPDAVREGGSKGGTGRVTPEPERVKPFLGSEDDPKPWTPEQQKEMKEAFRIFQGQGYRGNESVEVEQEVNLWDLAEPIEMKDDTGE